MGLSSDESLTLLLKKKQWVASNYIYSAVVLTSYSNVKNENTGGAKISNILCLPICFLHKVWFLFLLNVQSMSCC